VKGLLLAVAALPPLSYREVDEDTEKPTAFDEYLAGRGIRGDV
jgi:hypothetical protein